MSLAGESSSVARLAIDYGASSITAALAGVDGRWQLLQIDGAVTIPAAVAVSPDGVILTGGQAWQQALADPRSFLASPLSAATPQVQLGGLQVEVIDLVAAVLRRVGDEAARLAGEPVVDVRLVVPASWGPRRRMWMRQAASKAGLGQLLLEYEILVRGVVGGCEVSCNGGPF